MTCVLAERDYRSRTHNYATSGHDNIQNYAICLHANTRTTLYASVMTFKSTLLAVKITSETTPC
jgi:hypothetical protein